MRVLIVGGDSMIGARVGAILAAQGHQVSMTSRRPGAGLAFDLADADPETLPLGDTDCLILAAAVASRAACEQDPAGTAQVNVLAPVRLAKPVLARGGQVVFLSTHAVLGGASPFLAPDAPFDPPDAYSTQKADAERALRALGGALTIVRPTKILAARSGLIAAWSQNIAAGQQIDVFTDLHMAPASLEHASRQIADAVTTTPSVLHISGAAEISYADFAQHLAQRFGWRADLIHAIAGRPINPIAAMTPPHASLAADVPQTLDDLLADLAA